MTTVTRSEFARLQGWAKSYVTQLGHQGRLVTADDGKVDVEKTLQRLQATRDPNRDDVQKRHQAARETRNDLEAPTDATEALSDSYAAARARKERAAADMAEMERDQMRGRLLQADDVRRVIAHAATQMRTTLESMPDRLAPELAAITEQNQIHARLQDEVEHVLTELSRGVAEL